MVYSDARREPRPQSSNTSARERSDFGLNKRPDRANIFRMVCKTFAKGRRGRGVPSAWREVELPSCPAAQVVGTPGRWLWKASGNKPTNRIDPWMDRSIKVPYLSDVATELRSNLCESPAYSKKTITRFRYRWTVRLKV